LASKRSLRNCSIKERKPATLCGTRFDIFFAIKKVREGAHGSFPAPNAPNRLLRD
jgi:hypothetical protein